MLYVFAGFPRSGLNAGGVKHYVETQDIGNLEHDPAVQYRKEGVFLISPEGAELTRPIEYRMSNLCLRDGIGWDWFPENWSFGNGLTVHKTTARPEYETVVRGTDLTLDEFLIQNGVFRLADIELRQKQTTGWEVWKARWAPGTCPTDSVEVHLTWFIFKHKLPEFSYKKLRESIEDIDYELPEKDFYDVADEPGKYKSEPRVFL